MVSNRLPAGMRQSVTAFVAEHILPLEAVRASYDDGDNLRIELCDAIREHAKTAGLWCPTATQANGGLGLDMVSLGQFLEASNYSIFGPACFNAAAPDEGNIRMIERIGTPEQVAWWGKPLIDGTVRSAFAMTEPHPGGGSDPTMITTRAEKAGGDWRITGRKWFTTGGGIAKHFVVVARTSDDRRRGLTAFLFPATAPGWRIVRRIPIMGPEEHGGHVEIAFEGLVVPDRDRLLEIGDGLKVTQIRLGPARLTHCMRWLGLATRCIDLAVAYAQQRAGFGQLLIERESIQIRLGEVAASIATGRLLVKNAAEALDRGERARAEISLAKLHVANTIHVAADTALQINGARGYSKDTPIEWIYRYARQARLVDGADEVHKMVLAQELIHRETPTDTPTSSSRETH